MLSSKQRAYLRSLANDYETIFQIGKGGINDNMVGQVSDALEARELIKLRVLDNCEISSREASIQIAASTCSDVVQVIGSRFILYRESEKNKKIFLPK